MLGYKKEMGSNKMEVIDCEYPNAAYSEKQPGKANEYKQRHDRILVKEASHLRNEAYKGRYK